MKLLNLNSFSFFEKIFFLGSIFFIFLSSFLLHDNVFSIFAGLFGVIYTILAGKGRYFCFVAGVISIVLYAYLALQNELYANFVLYIFYYLPLSFFGFFNWKKNLKNEFEIYKTSLDFKANLILMALSFLVVFVLAYIFKYENIFDLIIFVFSILAMYMTSKRYIQQWIIWFFVDCVSFLVCLKVCIETSSTWSIAITRLLYALMAVYFYKIWQKDIYNDKIKKKD